MPSPQQKMHAILTNYFEISNLLRDDVSALLDVKEDASPIWRRAFIRAIVPLVEGYCYSFLSICYENTEIDPQKRRQVDPNRRTSVTVRTKNALKHVFEQFELFPAPDFSKQEWENVQCLFGMRDDLMHPKTANSLIFTDEKWARAHEGAIWLLGHIFRVPELLERKFAENEGCS